MHAIWVGAFLVDLVDGDDDRHLRGARVVDRLDGLRHDAVIGGYDEDDDVGDLRTTRAHGGERLVGGGVDEHNPVPIGRLDLVPHDSLGYAPGFARNDARLA